MKRTWFSCAVSCGGDAILLTTERLNLRPLSLDDADFILELVTDASFIRNIGDKGVRTRVDACGYLLTGPLASYEEFGFGLYMVEHAQAGEALGICGLLKRDWLDDVDIGFAFLPRYWSNGYAIESALAVKAYAREQLGLERLAAITAPDNSSSIRVLEKLGFEFSGWTRAPNSELELRLFKCTL